MVGINPIVSELRSVTSEVASSSLVHPAANCQVSKCFCLLAFSLSCARIANRAHSGHIRPRQADSKGADDGSGFVIPMLEASRSVVLSEWGAHSARQPYNTTWRAVLTLLFMWRACALSRVVRGAYGIIPSASDAVVHRSMLRSAVEEEEAGHASLAFLITRSMHDEQSSCEAREGGSRMGEPALREETILGAG